MLRKYYFFTLFLLFKTIFAVWFFMGVKKKFLYEERVYVFVIFLIVIFFGRFFSDLVDSFLSSRTELVCNQYMIVFEKKIENAKNLILLFSDTVKYYLEIESRLRRIFLRLYFLFCFLSKSFLLSFLWLNFYYFISFFFFNFVKKFSFFFDSYFFIESVFKFREGFFFIFIDLLKVLICFLKNY
jgi:hypothetical protein